MILMMKKIIITIIFTLFVFPPASAHDAEPKSAAQSGKTNSANQYPSSSKWFIIPNVGTFNARQGYAMRKIGDDVFPALTVGCLGRQFGGYVAGEVFLHPLQDVEAGITLGTLSALGATKKHVVQVGLKWFHCSTGYYSRFFWGSSSNEDTGVEMTKVCLDLGYIHNKGPLSFNVACGLGKGTIQPRLGIGINF